MTGLLEKLRTDGQTDGLYIGPASYVSGSKKIWYEILTRGHFIMPPVAVV